MKISIIIPYEHDRGWLDKAIESVENQTYKNFELIISNGNGGVSANLNDGIKKATGDLVRYLCEDDMLTKDSLYHTVTRWENRFDFIHSNAINFNSINPQDRTAWIPKIMKPTLKDMIRVNQLHGGTVVYHARCFEGNTFDESLWTCEEYDFNMKLLSQGKTLGYVDAFTYLYRIHKDQKSIGNRNSSYQNKRNRVRTMVQNRYKI